MSLLKLLKPVLVLTVASLLSSCAAKHYEYVPPDNHQGKMCVARCSHGKKYCDELSDLKNGACIKSANEASLKDYQAYVVERNKNHLPIKKTLQSFDHTDRCRTRYSCVESFNVCYSACGGEVSNI